MLGQRRGEVIHRVCTFGEALLLPAREGVGLEGDVKHGHAVGNIARQCDPDAFTRFHVLNPYSAGMYSEP